MFFELQNINPQAIAVIDNEQVLSYAELKKQCTVFRQVIDDASSLERPLVFLKAQNDMDTLVAYLCLLQSRIPTLLLDPDIQNDKLDKLTALYQPNLLVEHRCIIQVGSHQHNMSPDLALLLSTSGSTGSPKQVCLSANNLQANAQSICDYLPIQAEDKTITTLPFFYSYGLSVINSHLLEGACIVLNKAPILSRDFWDVFKQRQVTSFAGVPYSYQMLVRLKFTEMDLPSLRYFTQAGGKLNPDTGAQLVGYAAEQNKQFFIMYGQTEATARMAYIAQQDIKRKPHSIGQSIPGGEFSLVSEQGKVIEEPNQKGELVYTGKNVMLGYAESVSDLAGFAPLKQLHTGDIAYRDGEGDYFIVGRKKRFIKLFGQRINLDEVEQLLAQKQLETYCLGDDTRLIVTTKKTNDIKVLRTTISGLLNVHPSVIKVFSLDELPITANGKKDYQAVFQAFESLKGTM